MKSLVLSHRKWEQVWAKIKEEYADSPSIFLVRSKMRDQLGFTFREHVFYRGVIEYVESDDWRDYRSQICIDFYSESARTMFMLKYL